MAGWVRKVEVDASEFTESGHEGFEEAFVVGRLVVGLHGNGTHLGLHRPAMGGSPNPESLSQVSSKLRVLTAARATRILSSLATARRRQGSAAAAEAPCVPPPLYIRYLIARLPGGDKQL